MCISREHFRWEFSFALVVFSTMGVSFLILLIYFHIVGQAILPIRCGNNSNSSPAVGVSIGDGCTAASLLRVMGSGRFVVNDDFDRIGIGCHLTGPE